MVSAKCISRNNLLPAIHRLSEKHPSPPLNVDFEIMQRLNNDDTYQPSKQVVKKLLVWAKGNSAFETAIDGLDRKSLYEYRTNSKGIAELSQSYVPLGRYFEIKLYKAAFDNSTSADALAENCMRALTMCGAMARGKGVLIEYLIFCLSLRRTLRGLRCLLSRSDLTPGVLKRIVRMLGAIDPYLILARGLRNESERWSIPQLPQRFDLKFAKAKKANSEDYLVYLKVLSSHPLAYDRPASVQSLRRITQVLVIDCRHYPRKEYLASLRKLKVEVELLKRGSKLASSERKLHEIENPLGKLLISEFLFSLNFDGIYRKVDQLWVELHATQILCALNYYERVNGRLPDSLAELRQDTALRNIVHCHPFISGRLIFSRRTRLLSATKKLSENQWIVPEFSN